MCYLVVIDDFSSRVVAVLEAPIAGGCRGNKGFGFFHLFADKL